MHDLSWILHRVKGHCGTAFINREQAYSFQDIVAHVEQWNTLLDAVGVTAGDSVVLIGDYSLQIVAAMLALTVRRCIITPLYKPDQEKVEAVGELVAAKAIIAALDSIVVRQERAGEICHPLFEELRSSGEAGLVLLSSGSSGQPKAMLLSLNRLLDKYRESTPRSMSVLLFLLFDHIGGINTLFHTLLNGGVLLSAFARTPQEICALIEKHRVEVLPTTPTFINVLLASKIYRDYDLSSLKMITYGTELMPQSTLESLAKAFPSLTLKQTYGMSEIGILPTKSESNTSLWMRMGNENTQVKIVENVLWVKTSTAMLGYLNAESPFDDNAWLCTGDLVEERHGYFRILGRGNSMINVGGLKVQPAEIEDCVLRVPGVLDVVAWPKKNAVTGHVVAVTIMPEHDVEKAALRKLIIDYCSDQLDAYKVPRFFEFSDTPFYTERFKKIIRRAE